MNLTEQTLFICVTSCNRRTVRLFEPVTAFYLVWQENIAWRIY